MKLRFRFTLTHLMLIVTWLAIIIAVARPYFLDRPFTGFTHDVEGTTFNHYAFEEAYTTTIEPEAVAKSPAWSPSAPNPPISARRALLIAEKYRHKRLIDHDNWRWGLDSIALYPLDGARGKWCWAVNFTAYPSKGGFSGIPPEFCAFVLMDGNVVEAKASPNDLLRDWKQVDSPAQK
jgi:hypothetical protein